mmetsp:Transcript_42029/g.164620  ORF Transcript_42029/g.164620 Transcript_42029/m.164620 type:complete len:143 (-) Transcript_42029:2107-2535(-)
MDDEDRPGEAGEENMSIIADSGKCPVCGRGFRRKWNLKTHMRIHTDVLPYACDDPGCKKRFKWSSSLQYHKRTHDHGTQSSRPTRVIDRDNDRSRQSGRGQGQSNDGNGKATTSRNPMSINFLTNRPRNSYEDEEKQKGPAS